MPAKSLKTEQKKTIHRLHCKKLQEHLEKRKLSTRTGRSNVGFVCTLMD